MITPQIFSSKTVSAVEQKQARQLRPCTLKWRQSKLFVKSCKSANPLYLPALENQQWLVDCLKHSPVKLVSLDPKLGETELMFWADACEQADKNVFLSLPSNPELPRKRRPMTWSLKRILDWNIAVLLLLILSPVMLALTLVIRVSSAGPVFLHQWRVGKRGQLFRIIKFRTRIVNAETLHHQMMSDLPRLHQCEDDPYMTSLGCWMQKYGLDTLPQLINVVRGEMSLVGPNPWALYDAVKLSPKGQQRLNARPGISGIWQVMLSSHRMDIETINYWDLEYLSSWSLKQDLKILLLTVPRVMSSSSTH
ncbi:MAG TPA: heterocyst development glycosyltransferase HepC [Coleofasciculaceae cyanobacterium]